MVQVVNVRISTPSGGHRCAPAAAELAADGRDVLQARYQIQVAAVAASSAVIWNTGESPCDN